MPAIHQFVAGYTNGDAISNEAVTLRNVFRSWGSHSEIFSDASRILPELRKECCDVSDYAANSRPEDIVLLHFSIGSMVNDAFAALDCRKVFRYHNITPSHYFDLINKQTAFNLEQGRKQLNTLSETATLNMAVSQYNASELESTGYRDVKVLPLILDFDKLSGKPDRKIMRRFGDGLVNVLFVGRCAPNRKIEDALEAFYCFNKFVEPNSRFIHVGSFAGAERYYYLLLAQIRDMGMNNVFFAGSVPQSHLNAFYQCSDMFLCMSEHEGFCIPIVESMHNNLPVLAYAAAAIPETMDGAGILIREKHYEMIAEMMGRVARDTEFRNAIIKGQQNRLANYRERDLAAELRTLFKPLLKGSE